MKPSILWRLIGKVFRIVRTAIENTQVDLYSGLNIGDGTRFSTSNLDGVVPQLIRIGRNCIIAPRAVILTHDASYFIHSGEYLIKPVNIGDRVFIGYGAVILPGVSIGDGAVVGAGAVVARDVPANTVVAGVPAKVIGTVEEMVAREATQLFAPPFQLGQKIGRKEILAFQRKILSEYERRR